MYISSYLLSRSTTSIAIYVGTAIPHTLRIKILYKDTILLIHVKMLQEKEAPLEIRYQKIISIANTSPMDKDMRILVI